MKNTRKCPASARLGLEQLEPRWAMAGNVTVSVSGANLKITGDDSENDIAMFVDANPVPNTLHIEGRNGTGVTINGTLPAGNAVGNVTMDMKKASIPVIDPPDPRGALGVDRVEIDDVIMGDLLIKGKNGCVVNIDQLNARKTTIDFDAGNGVSAVVAGIPLGSQVDITNSNLGFDGRRSPPREAGVTVATKDNRDHVEMRNTTVHGNLKITTKGEIDEIGLFGIFNFFGSGTFGLQNLTIDSGAGNDLIAGSGLDVIKKTSIKSGLGDDTVAIGRFEGFGSSLLRGTVLLDTNKGTDTTAVGSILGSGGFSTTFNSKITYKGGTEDDTLLLGLQIVVPPIKHSIDGGANGLNGDRVRGDNPPFDVNDATIFKNWESRAGADLAAMQTIFVLIGTTF